MILRILFFLCILCVLNSSNICSAKSYVHSFVKIPESEVNALKVDWIGKRVFFKSYGASDLYEDYQGKSKPIDLRRLSPDDIYLIDSLYLYRYGKGTLDRIYFWKVVDTSDKVYWLKDNRYYTSDYRCFFLENEYEQLIQSSRKQYKNLIGNGYYANPKKVFWEVPYPERLNLRDMFIDPLSNQLHCKFRREYGPPVVWTISLRGVNEPKKVVSLLSKYFIQYSSGCGESLAIRPEGYGGGTIRPQGYGGGTIRLTPVPKNLFLE